MQNLTPREQVIVRQAGRGHESVWIGRAAVVLGVVGGLGIVVAAVIQNDGPDIRAIAYGLTVTSFIIAVHGMRASQQESQNVIAKLRDQIDQAP
jgi:hypothetical protein